MKERKRQTEMSVEGRKDVREYVWREKERERRRKREKDVVMGEQGERKFLSFSLCVCFQKKRLPAVSVSVVHSIQIIISMHPSL